MSDKIEDFGEKIGGAKKDLWKERNLSFADVSEMTDIEKFKYVNKNNIWKKPDYVSLVENGVKEETAYLLKKIRDSYKATLKPFNDKEKNEKLINNYIDFTEKVRDELEKVKDNDDLYNLFDRIFVDNGYYNKNVRMRGCWTNKAQKLNLISNNKFVKAVQVTPYHVKQAKDEVINSGFLDDKVEAWRKNIDIKNYKDGFAIVKKKGYMNLILESGFESREAAEKYLNKELKPVLTSRKKSAKIVRPQLSKVERVGEDYRSGKDITTDEFMNTFGFRAGEFGNWNTQADRQQSLNMAYDSFMDLSKVLNVDTKAMSLNAELAIAFGARGKGGALAHYEPARVVINLTKMKGAGALAHEFGHALDDYLGRKSGDKTILEPFVSSGITKNSKLHIDTKSAFQSVMSTILKRDKTKEEISDEINKELNRLKKNFKTWFDRLPKELENEQRTGNKIRRKATEKELSEANRLIDNIINGSDRTNDIDKLNNLNKAIKGTMLSKELRDNAQSFIYWLDSKEESLKNADKIQGKVDTDFVKAAKELDKGKSKDYWSSKVELFARAFECYVSDKISNKENKSDYLVHSTKNSSYGEYKPYPEGAERKKIFDSFDNLFTNIKELEKAQNIQMAAAKNETDKADTNKIERLSVEQSLKDKDNLVSKILDDIKGVDAFKADKSKTEYIIAAPSLNNINKIEVKYFEDNEPVKSVLVQSKEILAEKLASEGYVEIKEKFKIKAKNIGSISLEELKKMPGKEFVISVKNNDDIIKIKNLNINYALFKTDDSMKVIIKNEDRSKTLEALGLRDKEIGNVAYSEFKAIEGKNRYILVTMNEIDKLKKSEIKHAAFIKEDKVNLVVKEKDLQEVFKAMNRPIEIQFGNCKYSEIKNSPGEVRYKIYDNKYLEEINKAGIKFSAFDKGNGKSNIAFKEKDLQKIQDVISKAKSKTIDAR